jgi:hypothetical protein
MGVNMFVKGLENFKLTRDSFHRLGNRRVLAHVILRTFEVTPAVQRLPPSKRLAYMTSRVDRWIRRLYRLYPELSFRQKNAKLFGRSDNPWSQLPSTLLVRGPASEILRLADAAGVGSIYVTRVAGRRRRRSPKSPLAWYCVRAFVVIRIERVKSGMQMTEDRFILVRGSSIEDAKKRLKRQWREYAIPYLNSNGEMVSWSLDRVTDAYDTGLIEIDPVGTEVYSKGGQRRIRPEYVWRPKSR